MSSCSASSTFLVAFNASLLSLLLLLLLGCGSFEGADALVVPQELPSILSLVYSNIPPIKKGTDSRLGFGFRLGEHADFQVILELGPQKETRPLGEKTESDSSFNKRQVSKAQQSYALRQQLRKELSSTERTATGSWLENWSKNMQPSNDHIKKPIKSKAPHLNKKQKEPLNTVEMPNAPVVAPQSLRQLQLLYHMASSSSTPAPESTSAASVIPTERTTPLPFKGGRLNLGGPAGFTARPVEETLLQQMLDLRTAAQQKTKSEITKELSDVSLDDEP